MQCGRVDGNDCVKAKRKRIHLCYICALTMGRAERRRGGDGKLDNGLMVGDSSEERIRERETRKNERERGRKRGRETDMGSTEMWYVAAMLMMGWKALWQWNGNIAIKQLRHNYMSAKAVSHIYVTPRNTITTLFSLRLAGWHTHFRAASRARAWLHCGKPQFGGKPLNSPLPFINMRADQQLMSIIKATKKSCRTNRRPGVVLVRQTYAFNVAALAVGKRERKKKCHHISNSIYV